MSELVIIFLLMSYPYQCWAVVMGWNPREIEVAFPNLPCGNPVIHCSLHRVPMVHIYHWMLLDAFPALRKKKTVEK